MDRNYTATKKDAFVRRTFQDAGIAFLCYPMQGYVLQSTLQSVSL